MVVFFLLFFGYYGSRDFEKISEYLVNFLSGVEMEGRKLRVFCLWRMYCMLGIVLGKEYKWIKILIWWN